MKQLHLQALALLALTNSSASAIKRVAISAINQRTIYNVLKKSPFVQTLNGNLYLNEEGQRKLSVITKGKVDFKHEVSTIGRLMSMLDACMDFIQNTDLVIYKGTSGYALLQRVQNTVTELLNSAQESRPSPDSDTKDTALIAESTQA